MRGRNRLAIHLIGKNDRQLPRRLFQNLAEGERTLKWGQVLLVMALIVDPTDILFGVGQGDDFAQGDTLPQTHVKGVLPIGAVAYMHEPDRLLLGQTHQSLPVQGIAPRKRERLLHHAVARRVRNHFQRLGIRNETNLAKLLGREFGRACLSLVQDKGAVKWSQILQLGDGLP